MVCKASMVDRLGGPSAFYIHMHCTGSSKKTNLVYWYARHLCSIDRGVHLPSIYIYMHCTRSSNKTDLVYQYARHLCSIDGGSICLWYLYVY